MKTKTVTKTTINLSRSDINESEKIDLIEILRGETMTQRGCVNEYRMRDGATVIVLRVKEKRF